MTIIKKCTWIDGGLCRCEFGSHIPGIGFPGTDWVPVFPVGIGLLVLRLLALGELQHHRLNVIQPAIGSVRIHAPERHPVAPRRPIFHSGSPGRNTRVAASETGGGNVADADSRARFHLPALTTEPFRLPYMRAVASPQMLLPVDWGLGKWRGRSLARVTGRNHAKRRRVVERRRSRIECGAGKSLYRRSSTAIRTGQGGNAVWRSADPAGWERHDVVRAGEN